MSLQNQKEAGKKAQLALQDPDTPSPSLAARSAKRENDAASSCLVPCKDSRSDRQTDRETLAAPLQASLPHLSQENSGLLGNESC